MNVADAGTGDSASLRREALNKHMVSRRRLQSHRCRNHHRLFYLRLHLWPKERSGCHRHTRWCFREHGREPRPSQDRKRQTSRTITRRAWIRSCRRRPVILGDAAQRSTRYCRSEPRLLSDQNCWSLSFPLNGSGSHRSYDWYGSHSCRGRRRARKRLRQPERIRSLRERF